jgi:hypothetical protein
MKKIYWEILASIVFVLGGTVVVYGQLKHFPIFWDAQSVWSVILIIGWIVVALGYYHQGWMVHKGHSAIHVSAWLPTTVFFVQCVLFVKGIFFHDWSLIFGALIVNSGVVFSLYHIFEAKRKRRWK